MKSAFQQPFSLLSGLALSALAVSGARGDTLETEAFFSPTSFTFSSGVNDFHAASLAETDAAATTHLLLLGLNPVEAGSSVVTSHYRGIDRATGEVTETGSLVFTSPAPASTAGGAAPIVGFVTRNGSWEDYAPQTPAVVLGEASGSLTVVNNTVAIELTEGTSTFTGTAPFTATDESQVTLGDFSLSDGTRTLEFYGTSLEGFSGSFYGVLQKKNPEGVTSTLFALRLSELADSDKDGSPDLFDLDGGAGLAIGDWRYSPSMSWAWAYDNDWAYSLLYGYIYYPENPWLYIHEFGWAYTYGLSTSGGRTAIWLYMVDEGYLYVPVDGEGDYYDYSDATWRNFFGN